MKKEPSSSLVTLSTFFALLVFTGGALVFLSSFDKHGTASTAMAGTVIMLLSGILLGVIFVNDSLRRISSQLRNKTLIEPSEKTAAPTEAPKKEPAAYRI